jgi:hypothetical protein
MLGGPLDSEQLRLKKIAFLQAHGALGLRMNGALRMVANRVSDVRRADALGDGRLADRARRKTREHLADAQAKLDREIERTIDRQGLRGEWENFDPISDDNWQEIEGLFDSPVDGKRRAEEDEFHGGSQCQEWEASLGPSIPPGDYVERADQLLSDQTRRPVIPDWTWDLMTSILGALGFPQDTDEYVQIAAAVFDLYFAETWDSVDPQRVDELIDEGFASANDQRTESGKPMLSASDPKTRFTTTATWWVSDRSGAFNSLRSYIESQPAYSRLLSAREPLFGDDPNMETLWNTGIASAVSWMFAAPVES